MSAAATTTRPAYAKAWRNAIFVVFLLNGLRRSPHGSAASRASATTWQLSTTEVGILLLGVSVGSIVGLIAPATSSTGSAAGARS